MHKETGRFHESINSQERAEPATGTGAGFLVPHPLWGERRSQVQPPRGGLATTQRQGTPKGSKSPGWRANILGTKPRFQRKHDKRGGLNILC